MADFNRLFQTISQSKPLLSESECVELRNLIKTVHQKWMKVKNGIESATKMPPKYHYLHHCVEMCLLFKMPLGYYDEEGLEGSHQICNDLRRAYLNQRGVFKVKYMMAKMFLITSPKYLGAYTT